MWTGSKKMANRHGVYKAFTTKKIKSVARVPIDILNVAPHRVGQ